MTSIRIETKHYLFVSRDGLRSIVRKADNAAFHLDELSEIVDFDEEMASFKFAFPRDSADSVFGQMFSSYYVPGVSR